MQHIVADYDALIMQLIDMFPDFRMRLKLDKKTGKVMHGADVQSVFDICWYTFSRIVADVAPPIDPDLRYEEFQGAILSCLCCGEFFIRHSSRQIYCDNPTVKQSAIAKTEEPTMLAKRLLKQNIRHKIDPATLPGVGCGNEVNCFYQSYFNFSHKGSISSSLATMRFCSARGGSGIRQFAK